MYWKNLEMLTADLRLLVNQTHQQLAKGSIDSEEQQPITRLHLVVRRAWLLLREGRTHGCRSISARLTVLPLHLRKRRSFGFCGDFVEHMRRR